MPLANRSRHLLTEIYKIIVRNELLYQYISARVNFTNNAAKFGGGLSLEANARL